MVTAHGKITAIRDEGAETIVDLDVWTENDSGQPMAPGSATVAIPKVGPAAQAGTKEPDS